MDNKDRQRRRQQKQWPSTRGGPLAMALCGISMSLKWPLIDCSNARCCSSLYIFRPAPFPHVQPILSPASSTTSPTNIGPKGQVTGKTGFCFPLLLLIKKLHTTSKSNRRPAFSCTTPITDVLEIHRYHERRNLQVNTLPPPNSPSPSYHVAPSFPYFPVW